MRAYYCFLAAIHDEDLKAGTAITRDTWPPELLKCVHQRLWGFWCDNTDLLRTALECVKADLAKNGQEANGQGRPSEASDSKGGRKPIVGETWNVHGIPIYWGNVISRFRSLSRWKKLIVIVVVILIVAFVTCLKWLPLVHPHGGTRNIEQQRGNLGSTPDQ